MGAAGLILAVDVAYGPVTVAAGVGFLGWEADRPSVEHRLELGPAAEYEPGQFYRRELPAVLALLEHLPRPAVLVVDGYIWLGAERRPGLGWHVAEATGLPVVGVAKTAFQGTPEEDRVYRGTSRVPLYVQGLQVQDAGECVRRMHGPYRIPTLLKRVDQLTRVTA